MKRIFIIFSLLALTVFSAQAQEIRVMGKVVSTVDDSPLESVYVWVFKTAGAGKAEYKNALASYEAGGYEGPEIGRYEYTMADGTYTFTMEAGGSLIFNLPPFKPEFLEVKGKNELKTVKIEATTVLDDSVIEAEAVKKTRKSKPVVYGNKIEQPVYYYFDEEMMGAVEGVGKSNARFVAQAFITNADGSDTLHYFPPRVYDGEQFHQTQYHWSNDYLYDIADKMPRLTPDRDTVEWHLSYSFPEGDQSLYYGKAHIWVEDYNNTYYTDTLNIFNTGRVSRPYQFLEYSFDECHLDPQEYFKEAKLENVSTPKNMKLKFLVNKDELDRSDVSTMASLDSLKDELRMITSDPDYTLSEILFNGYSSPDGQYAKNKPLSDARTNTVFREVWSVIPRSWQDRVFHKENGHVAPWSDVADLLEKQALSEEAADVREIIERNPDNIDKQGQEMKRLSYYSSKISPLLNELRSVKCEYKYSVYRYLEPEEILKKYETDPAVRNGTKPLTLNEYWNLYQLIDDEKELEDLYKKGLAASFNTERKFWPLPANHLAVQKLKRKEVDTLLLSSFIDENYRANMPWTDKNGKKDYPKNPDPIVANQVQMFMLAKNYERAEELSSIIENEHPMLRAIVRCLGGYIDFEDPAEERTIELIRQSSPRNEVIIMLANNPRDTTIYASLNKLPQDQALTQYLRAQHLCLMYDNDVNQMRKDFNRDRDPEFTHPKDEIVPAATPEEIEAQKKEIERINFDIEGDIALFGAASEDLLAELKVAQEVLAVMEKGEVGIKPYTGFSEYEAAKIYLQRCFEIDPKFILTAKADYDIAEDLLNDVLGIETK